MEILASAIFVEFRARGLLTEHRGPDVRITGMMSLEDSGPGDLVFIDNAKYLPVMIEKRPAAVVATEPLAAAISAQTDQIAILVSPNVRLATAYIRQRYQDRNLYQSEWPRVHPSAVIHDSVVVPEDAVIGPGAVIGAGVKIGARSVIMANAVVEADAVIGDRTVIHPGCVVGYACELGADVILKSGCVIGAEGQGFAQDEQHRHHRIPQTGIVVIEDRVVIGANCTIDRATYTETRVHSGCIIDAQCHLGHNVVIGEDCILVAQTGIAGSSRFGKRVVASGQTGVLDHVSVPDDTVLVHRAGVINSIHQSGRYATTPPQPFKQYLKNIAVFQRLGEVWTRLKALEKKVAELSAK